MKLLYRHYCFVRRAFLPESRTDHHSGKLFADFTFSNSLRVKRNRKKCEIVFRCRKKRITRVKQVVTWESKTLGVKSDREGGRGGGHEVAHCFVYKVQWCCKASEESRSPVFQCDARDGQYSKNKKKRPSIKDAQRIMGRAPKKVLGVV